ncbi:lysophospholipid acyltransferase family protein [Methylomicrobium sp. Wu6]|uniref:lysophospholipid acyltransferase family protein n=1 Tax=Methylomicrobium sp. Wu6 TaxID=3107928 RepID=UPI002DD65F82|nr:lysophospholipid acyltransferase family protein [Methylomicrobium sp. Wu6]
MLRLLFHLIIVKPLVLIVLGINARNRHLLPAQGPAILVANHNSHLDTLALMSLFPLHLANKIRPVAAADYFLRNRLLKWITLNAIGIIPLERHASNKTSQLLKPLVEALRRGDILILFPEGSRGEPEMLGKLKNGIAHLISQCPETPVVPIFFHGLGKALPKGEIILVPFIVDAFVGEALYWEENRQAFMEKLAKSMTKLQTELAQRN